MKHTRPNKLKSYLDYYESYIMPKLKEIDLTIKLKRSIKPTEAASLLDVSVLEINRITREHGIKNIDKSGFFEIMETGSSEICKLLKNEATCGIPVKYSVEDVAFIYGLDVSSVFYAFKRARVLEASTEDLASVFSYIPLSSAIRLFY